jgi:pimeloyl-ACP methyl ester carboxylesterase
VSAGTTTTEHVCTVFFLPGLGFSAQAAAPLAAEMGDRFRVVGIDLPGQGSAPDAADGSVAAQVDAAVATIGAEIDGGPCMLVAHSMGGKIAALVAARALDGRAEVFGLAGAVLLAPSPPTPEPMDDDKRAEMLAWVADGPLDESAASEFVAQNVASPLSAADEKAAIEQVRATSALSWRRWLDEGSREDVSAAVGSLDLPVTVLGGEDDDDLGSLAQSRLIADVYPRARFVSLPETGHLLPYERPADVAAEVVRLWEAVAAASPTIPRDWGLIIASGRTGREARALLARRMLADDPDYRPRALTPRQLDTLRSLADRLLPQDGAGHIDLAARIDRDLADGRTDGWRPAKLPDDPTAYRLGLTALADAWPHDTAEQDALIRGIIDGDGIPGGPWEGDIVRRWFEDVRNDLTRLWLAHPVSLARIGYDGFATSGDHAEPAGYVALAAGQRDPWEPADLGRLGDRLDRGDNTHDENTHDENTHDNRKHTA